MNVLKKLGFDRQTAFRFLLVCLGSQIIFSFLAIRTVLYNPLIEALNITNTQFGVLMSMTGIGVLFAWALGYVQNRYPKKNILVGGLLLNALCILAISTAPPYEMLVVLFGIMGFQVMGLYFPTVLSTVASLADKEKQGTAFGSMELIRRITELTTNAIAVAVFGALGGGLLGIKATMYSAVGLIVIVAIFSAIYLPKDEPLDCDDKDKNKVALANLKIAMKLPEVYLAGFTAAGIYGAYTGLQYFLPFLNGVFALPVMYAAIFGLLNSSFTGMIASPVSGMLADNIFKSPIKYLSVLMVCLVGGLALVLVMPRTESMLLPTVAMLFVLTFMFYLGRGVYYAPIGELGLSKEVRGGAMSIASFIGYSPMFFAYAIFGYQIDNYEPIEAYNRIFALMLAWAVAGMVSAFTLYRRRNKRINLELAAAH